VYDGAVDWLCAGLCDSAGDSH